ncbi:hypothetical protein ES705_37491 [subsurface metagenome]
MRKKTLLTILIFGSLWGCIEVFAGGALKEVIPRSSVVPTILGLAVLATARFLLNKPGSSTAIGVVAMLFRLANAGGYFCHLWAIFLIGVSFDIVVSILGSRLEKTKWQGLAGVSSAYLTTSLFSLTLTYVFQYEWWAIPGLPEVLDYIGINGSLIAVGGLILVPFGYKLGKSLMGFSETRPKPAFIGALLL